MIGNEAIMFCVLHGSTDSHAIRHAALSVLFVWRLFHDDTMGAATTPIDVK